ncbi:uncharacterized protein KZ484_025026, partial [Pholidichthys leucotaenia]
MAGLNNIFVVVVPLTFLWTPSAADSDVFCVFNESCVLPCSYHVGDDPVIHWEKVSARHFRVHSFYYNQNQLSLQNHWFRGRTSLFEDQISRGNASLLLTGVKVQDEGRYKCYTSTLRGTNESFINLKVDAPVVRVEIKQEGKNITCSSGLIFPKPELIWSIRPPSNINSENTTQVHQNKEWQLYNISGSLKLPDSDDDDGDDLVYSCTISTSRNRWTVSLMKQTFSSETTIHCPASTSLKGFSLAWWFNHSHIIVSQTGTDVIYRVSKEWKKYVKKVSESGNLTLQDLSCSQEGTYTCKFSSAKETISTNFVLKIEGEKGIGKGTQKPLHYKGCLFHRIVKDFMIQGGDFSEEVVQTMENEKTDHNSRPYAEVKVLNCGELIPKSKANKDGKKKERASSSSSNSASASESSSESSSDSEESEKESKKQKKKTKKQKKKQKKAKKKSEPESAEEKEQEELVTSTVRPEEIPPIPENRFLMRRSPQSVQKARVETSNRTMAGLNNIFVVVVPLTFLWTPSAADSGVFCVFNESCTVPCDFQVGDDILIHWYKVEPGNQKELNVHSYYNGQDQLAEQNQEFTGRTSLFKKEISEGSASLLLTAVRVQDEGRYKCYSSTKKESKTLFINLKVDAPIHKVTIKQEGKNITCSSDLIYPEPKLTWSIRPPSNISLDNVTQVHQNKEQKLYNISGSLTLADSDDDDGGLVSSCTISSRANRWTAAARKQTFSSETTIPCTIPSISIKGFSLTWWFNHSQMIVNQTWTSVKWKRHTPNISESGDLMLQGLSSNQVGTYTCKLSSAVKTITTDSALKKKK